jgi:tetratricopeptide (TPR) repeat protein
MSFQNEATGVLAMSRGNVTIVSSESYRIDYQYSSGNADVLVFTFGEYNNNNLEGLGFAGKFLFDNGLDVISIKSRNNNWYQDLLPNALNNLEAFLGTLDTKYTSRSGYGSSMGAYGAIAFSRVLKLDRVFAISPQVSINVPWDKRWGADGSRIGQVRSIDAASIGPDCRYVVLYDPFDIDRKHADLLKAAISPDRYTPIQLPHAGHPGGYILNAVGGLKEVSLAALKGNEIPTWRDSYRANRNAYPAYYLNLAEHLAARRKFGWASEVIARALSLQPDNADFNICAATIAERRGRLDEALAFALNAIAVKPGHSSMLAITSRLQGKLGRLDQALLCIDRAIALAPTSTDFKAMRKAFVERLPS